MKSIKELFCKKKKKNETVYTPQPISDNMWVCPHCGTKNDIGAQFCKDCGIYR